MSSKISSLYIVLAALLLTAGFSFFPISVNAMTVDGLDYCQGGPQKFDVGYDEQVLCYVVKHGDTLWGIAEKYLDSGYEWSKLRVRSEFRRSKAVNSYIEDPRLLQPGTYIEISTGLIKTASGFIGVTGTPHIDFATGKLVTEQLKRAEKTNYESYILVGDEVVNGPFAFVFRPRLTEDREHITYRAVEAGDDSECRMRFYVDHTPNSHATCGWDFGLLSFNLNGSNYAVRNNKGTDPEEFIVLSSIGNGGYYHFSDSLMWLDNETLVYRAQINDEWRVVINHEDQEIFDYIEDLNISNGNITYRARSADGSWIVETIKYKPPI